MASYHLPPQRPKLPVILKGMIWTNIIVFGISLLFSGRHIHFSRNPMDTLAPSMNVLRFLGAAGTSAAKVPMWDIWWTFLNANWLHGSLIHLLFNMLALSTITPLVISQFGPYRMFTIYTVSGIIGFLLSYQATVYMTVGASAGICGLIGAALYYGKSSKGTFAQIVYKQTTGWVISLILIGFLIPNINNWGHGGGLLGGILSAWILGYDQKRKEHLFDRIIGVGLMGLTFFLLGKSVITGFFLIYT